MRETRAESSVVDQVGSSCSSVTFSFSVSVSVSVSLFFSFWRSGVCGAGVCGGVEATGFEERASKSLRSRPRGRVGGQVRWRFGVDGMECARVSGSLVWASSLLTEEEEEERRRLRLLRGGVRGCDFVILFACTVLCDFVFFGCAARGPAVVVRTMGLPRWGGGARMVLGLEDRVGRLLARSDCSARHVLYMLELGDWQVDGGGDSMVVVVAGM